MSTNGHSTLSSVVPVLAGVFRTGTVSHCADVVSGGGSWLAGRLVAYILYKLIGLFTNLFFFHEWSTKFRSVGGHHLGWWVIFVPVVGGLIVGVMAKYGIVENQGAWDSGGDGSGAGQPQPDRAQGGDSEADLGGDCNRDRRTVWR